MIEKKSRQQTLEQVGGDAGRVKRVDGARRVHLEHGEAQVVRRARRVDGQRPARAHALPRRLHVLDLHQRQRRGLLLLLLLLWR